VFAYRSEWKLGPSRGWPRPGTIPARADDHLGWTALDTHDGLIVVSTERLRLPLLADGEGIAPLVRRLVMPHVVPFVRAGRWVWEVVANGVVLDEFTRPVVQGGAGAFGGGRNGGAGSAPTLDTGGGAGSGLLDDFNRANGGLGSSWGVHSGTATVTSNQFQVNGGGSDNVVGAQWLTTIGSTNHWASAKFVSRGSGSPASGIVVRFTNNSQFTGFSLEWDQSAVFFVNVANASPTTYLSSVSNSETANDVFRGEAEGTTQRLKKNGSLISGASATNSSHASNTHVGLHAHTDGGTGNVVLDDFSGAVL
jgi:hypothetical protein